MKTPTLSAILMALTLFIWGCSDGDDSLKTTGKLNVFLVDAPFPTDQVAEANVTIFKIDARLAEDESDGDSESGEEGESQGGFITLMEEELGPINLLELVGGVQEKLVEAEIPAGTYDLIRVYVRDAEIVMNDDDNTNYDLKVPSGAQSGIKVFIAPPLQVAGGLSEDLILDFDVSKSFIPKGGSVNNPGGITGFNFTPVIRGSNLSTAGSIGGTVFLEAEGEGDPNPVEDAEITLYSLEDEDLTSTFTGPEGGYSISIEPGIYRVEVSFEGYETQSVEGVEVVLGNRTTLEDIVLVPVTETTGG